MGLAKYDFIVIDDSRLDCFIAEKIIRNTGKGENIKSFTQAPEALDYIKNNPAQSETIILVDIQMPVMTGFEFVEAFEKLSVAAADIYKIYVLSSSINETDMNRAHYHSAVKQFLNKPLTGAALMAALDML